MKFPLKHHPFTQLITLIIIMLISLFILSLIGFLLAIPLFNLSLQDIFNDLNPETLGSNILLFKYLQTIQTIGLFVVPPFVFAWFYSNRPLTYLHAKTKPETGSLIFVAFAVFVGIPFIGYLGKMNQAIDLPEFFGQFENWLAEREDQAQRLTEKFLTVQSQAELALNIFMIGVLPAIGEEFVFRGVLQKIMHKWTRNIHWAVFITAFAFSAMHVQFYGLIPRMFLGVLFGYLLVWSGSIWLPVIAHFVNNTTAVVYSYYMQSAGNISPTDLNNYEMPITVVILSLAGILFFCYMVYSNERKLR